MCQQPLLTKRMDSKALTRQLPKTSRTDAKCDYDLCWSTWRSRPILTHDTHALIADQLAELERRHDWKILYRSITPSSVLLRIHAPPTVTPIAIVSRIKASLHRALVEAQPNLKTRVNAVFNRAAYIRTVGSAGAESANLFLAREQGARNV
jgi:REP element-mobilizing transposase RayT